MMRLTSFLAIVALPFAYQLSALAQPTLSPELKLVENCLSSQIESSLDRFGWNVFEHSGVSVEHKGIEYHWLYLSHEGSVSKTKTIIAIADNYCEMPLIDAAGDIYTAEGYQKYLGVEVTEKFYQAWQRKRQSRQ